MKKKQIYFIISCVVLVCAFMILIFTVFKPTQRSLEELTNEPSDKDLTIWGKLDSKSITYDNMIPKFEIINDKGERIKIRLKAPVPIDLEKCNDVTLTGYYYIEVFVATAIDADCK